MTPAEGGEAKPEPGRDVMNPQPLLSRLPECLNGPLLRTVCWQVSLVLDEAGKFRADPRNYLPFS